MLPGLSDSSFSSAESLPSIPPNLRYASGTRYHRLLMLVVDGPISHFPFSTEMPHCDGNSATN